MTLLRRLKNVVVLGLALYGSFCLYQNLNKRPLPPPTDADDLISTPYSGHVDEYRINAPIDPFVLQRLFRATAGPVYQLRLETYDDPDEAPVFFIWSEHGGEPYFALRLPDLEIRRVPCRLCPKSPPPSIPLTARPPLRFFLRLSISSPPPPAALSFAPPLSPPF